jgi:uridine kinase
VDPDELPDTRSGGPRQLQSPDALITYLRAHVSGGHRPLIVGIDGRSGAGKSTLAAAIANRLGDSEHGSPLVTVIDGDQFYAGGSAESWDRRTAAEKADSVIDWRRQRHVLEQLRQRGVVEWFPFDWEADDWDSDIVPLAKDPIVTRATSMVILEGAYSCRPELHEILDLRVLVDIPDEVRRRRLLEREGEAYRSEWEARWSAAEEWYFNTVMPPERFDLILRSR